MKQLAAAVVMIATLLFAPGPGRAQAGADLKQYAERTEIRAIPSSTLSDAQFLTGSDGKPVVISGTLRLAKDSGRLPVVILLHGSGGMTGNIEYWSRELNAIGVSTFALDAFTARGLVATNTDQAALGRLNMVLDAYRALEVLARHPRVDPARIALMGFSRGGQAALYASLKRFHRIWNRSGIEFAAYLPFYPDCMTTYLTDTEVADRPIRIFHGTADDYDPIANCRAYVERLHAAGRDVQLTEYANASHAFDSLLLTGTEPIILKGAQTVRHCSIREEAAGELINEASKQPFTYKDACVELNPHIQYDPAATAAATRSVADILATVFKLPPEKAMR